MRPESLMLSGRKCSNLPVMTPSANPHSWFRRNVLFLWLVLLPLFPLWRAVFLGDAIGPYDQVRQMAPWNGPRPEQPWDVLPVDGAIQFSAWRDLVFQGWGRGEPPFWNPYQLAGTPLMANSQSGAFYPFHILLGVLHCPTFLAITLLAWFHLAVAGLGVSALTRKLGGNALGAVVAGSSFSLSAFMLAWTALPSVITTVAWIPWVLMFAWTVTSTCGREAGRAGLGLAVSIALMMLAGHLQFAAYGLIATGIIALGGLIINRDLRALLPLGLGIVAGCALALPHILPVLEYGKFSHRRNTPTMEGYQGYVRFGALKPFELGTLPWATLQGDPRVESSRSDAANPLPSYWPSLVKQGANFAESAIGVGPLVLALACFAPWRQRQAWPIAIIAVIALLLALGTPLNMALFFGVPGWSSTGSLARVLVLTVMMLCVMAGLGASKPLTWPENGLRKWLPYGIPIGFAIFGVVFTQQGSASAQNAEALNPLIAASMTQAMPAMLLGLILTGAVLFFFRRIDEPRIKLAVAFTPFLLAAIGYSSHLVPTGKPLDRVIGPASGQRIAVINDPWSLHVASPALLPPNTPSLNRIHDLGGYDSLLHRDTVGLLNDINGQDSAPEANGNIMFIKPKFDARKLAAAGVTQVWTRQDIPGLRIPEVKEQYKVYPLRGPGRASTPNGPATIGNETLNSLTVTAPGPGRLTVRDRNMPGWTATVDGKPVPIQGTLWREFDLSPGSHQVTMNYSPPGLSTGLMGFAFGLVLCAGFLVFPYRKAASNENVGARWVPENSQ